MNRSFKVVRVKSNKAKISKNGGRYISKKPSRAAKKAFNRIFRKLDKDYIKCEITIKETTKGSQKKEYSYLFTRIKKLTPLDITKQKKDITIKYKTLLKNFSNKDYIKLKSKKYNCSKKQKQNKILKTCCNKFNSTNYRTYQSCIKHIKRIR